MLCYWKYYFLIGLTVISTHQATAQSYGECTTPDYQLGTCKPLQECAQIYNKLQTTPLTPAERDYLRRSQCGYLNSKVLICCTDPPAEEEPVQVSAPRGGGASLLPRPPNCGSALEDRIINGEVTSVYEYPWMAMLEYTKPGNQKGHHCGGSLINDRYILTAAHCVTGSILSDWRLTGVRLGEWDTQTNPDCERFRNGKEECASPHVDIAIEQIIPHPQYVSTSHSQHNDIALLRLRDKVNFTRSIEPICLPLKPESRNFTYENRKVEVAGWGQTKDNTPNQRKLKTYFDITDFNDCKMTYTSQNISLQSTQICTSVPNRPGISNTCHVDSGGGLFTYEFIATEFEGRVVYFSLAGVASFGTTPCGLGDQPAVYTRVASYIDWIEEEINKATHS